MLAAVAVILSTLFGQLLDKPVDTIVFVVGAAATLLGAFCVVFSRNPVHSALNLVATLFGVAVLFVSLHAPFLAAVQVIVYAGAIVVLFLFVIMLLGVDREEAIEAEQLPAQRLPVVVPILAVLAAELALLSRGQFTAAVPQDAPGSIHPIVSGRTNIENLAEQIFTRYLFAFEVTSVLLVIAVVGAVVLARKETQSYGMLTGDRSRQKVAR